MGVLAGDGQAAASDPVTAVLDRTNSEPVEPPQQTERAQDRLRRRLGEATVLETDPVTGTPRILARLNGFLTPASSRDPHTIALEYVRDHADAFGLDLGDIADLHLTSSDRGPDGTVHLSWEQRAGGLPNVDGGLQAAVTAEGRLLNVRGGVVPDLDEDAPEPLVSATAAYATALPGAAPPPPASAPSGADRETSFAGGGSASLVRYQDDGEDRLGWRLLVPGGSDAFYDAIVDARTGALQRRVNRVRFASAINHFKVNPRALDENGEPTVSVVPAHWLAADADRLKGPYVHAVSDLDDSMHLADGGPPYVLTHEPEDGDEVRPRSSVGGESHWNFDLQLGPNDTVAELNFCEPLCSWKGSNRTANREFSTAQLFWYVNTFRDHLAAPPIGFTAARGGFEGDDPVLAQSLDGALTEDDDPESNLPHPDYLSNASMLTLPDGQRGLMQVNLFAVYRRYDGAHDAALVYHEYTHGLTERLVKDPQGFGALIGHQPDALAEGFSDFYALDFLAESEPTRVPDTSAPGEVLFGKWLQKDGDPERLLRTESLDCPVGDPAAFTACPGTDTAGQGGYDYGDFGRIGDDPEEEHDNGEIWAQTLWSLRTAITGADPTPAELARVRSYVTSALPLAPLDPTFLEMRNAILQAAASAGATDDWTRMWTVFASRGMGWSASTSAPDDIAPVSAFDMPPPPVDPPPPPPPPPPSNPNAPTNPTPPLTNPSPPVNPLRPTLLLDTKLSAKRKGTFKVRAFFGDAAPAGDARFTVLNSKRKRLARATTPVRIGGNVTKTLRLNRRGRRAIKPGRSKRVTLELRLPSGQKLNRSLRLARSKR